MATRYPNRNRYPTLTDEQFRDAFRPEQLPPPPWRYAITPSLVHTLTRVADAAGQLRASPVSYYRQKELAARAKRERILWNVSGIHRGVTHEEVEAVLRGGRLVERRRAAGEAIERALVLEDALAHEQLRWRAVARNEELVVVDPSGVRLPQLGEQERPRPPFGRWHRCPRLGGSRGSAGRGPCRGGWCCSG